MPTTSTNYNIPKPSGSDPANTGDNVVSSAVDAIDTILLGKLDIALYDANSILYATADNVPLALNVAASRIVGRKATGDISALSAAEVKAILALASADLSDFNEAVDDEVGRLLLPGAGITLTYNDPSNTLTVAATGGGAASWTKVATSTSVTAANKQVIEADGTSATVNITVPTGVEVLVKRMNSAGNNIVLLPATGNIDGAVNLALASQYDTAWVWHDGTNVQVLGKTVAIVASGGWTKVVTTVSITAANKTVIEADATSAAVTVTIPSGVETVAKRMNSLGSAVTVAPASGNIDGGPNVVLGEQFQGRWCWHDGTNVQILGERKPYGSPVALGTAPSDGTSGLMPRADHIHDITIAYTPINPAGTTQTLNMLNYDVRAWDIFLNADLAITFSNWLASKMGIAILRFHQDSVGGRKVSFVNTIGWAFDISPITPSPPNAVFEWIVQTPDGGTTLDGAHGQNLHTHRLHIPGTLSAGDSKLQERFMWDAKIVQIVPDLGGVPSGAAWVGDLKKGSGNGTASTVYTTTGNRPSVAVGNRYNGSVALPDVVTIAPFDYLVASVVTPSSATDLVLQVTCLEVV